MAGRWQHWLLHSRLFPFGASGQRPPIRPLRTDLFPPIAADRLLCCVQRRARLMETNKQTMGLFRSRLRKGKIYVLLLKCQTPYINRFIPYQIMCLSNLFATFEKEPSERTSVKLASGFCLHIVHYRCHFILLFLLKIMATDKRIIIMFSVQLHFCWITIDHKTSALFVEYL